MQLLMQALRLVLLAASFGGLCFWIGERFKLDGAFAPLVTACWIIVVLMLCGMAGILNIGWWALYLSGFAALVWCGFVKRARPAPIPTAILILGLSYAVWYFYQAYYAGNDSVSHWGLAVKYLVRTNRFPDASTELIFFQAYPLGTACLLYYFCRAVGFSEGLCMAAQFALGLAALLPVTGLMRKNRLPALIVFATLSALMLNNALTSLQVDNLLAYMTIGGVAMLAAYQDQPKSATAAILPVIAALTYVKSSGIVFSLLLAVGLFLAERSAGRAREGFRWTLLGVVLCLVLFGLWQIHVKLAFDTGFASKHAVSLQAYREAAAEKSSEDVRAIAIKMLKYLRHPNSEMKLIALICLGMDALMCIALWRRRKDRETWRPWLLRLIVGSATLFVLWYGMLFAMYLFSMPRDEALILASIYRYVRTILLLILGLHLILETAYCCRVEARRRTSTVLAVVAMSALLLCGTSQGRSAIQEFAHRPSSMPDSHASLLRISRSGQVEPERSYWVFSSMAKRMLGEAYYGTKYEFFSNDILMTVVSPGTGQDSENAYTFFRDTYLQQTDYGRVADLGAMFAENMDSVDYLLIFDEDPTFEAALADFLADYKGATKVVRGYEASETNVG